MRNGIVLNEEEQKSYCDRLTAVLAELRKRLGQTQEEMESLDERKAAMVSNLLVVLCGNRDAQPIVNSGSIY